MSSSKHSEAADDSPGFAPDLEPEVDRLYGLPLDDFTRERNELAKRLRKDGRRAEATRVGELTKPSVPAWVVNQLTRREPRGVTRLLAAGDAVRDAQQAAIGGGAPEELRAATDAQRDAVQELVRAARDVLRDAGRAPSDQVLDRVASTLRAASIDDDARPLLEAGRLAAEVEAARFELFPGLTPSSRPPERAKPKENTAAVRLEIRERTAALRELRDTARRLEREAGRAHKAAERAAAEADEREREADEAKADLAAAEEALADLKARLAG
jgi:hypothetical protein